MTDKFRKVFSNTKPVIAMVHLSALPGSPLYDAEGGLERLIADARKDLTALQNAGVDAVMFGNENDRPYEFKVDTASTATMAFIIGRLKSEIIVPFGVNVLWDPMSTVALAAATGAAFVREIFTGTYASDMGPWTPDAGAAMRYRDLLHRKDLAMLYNVSAEFAIRLIGAACRIAHAVQCSQASLMRFLFQARSQAKRQRCLILKRSKRLCRRHRFSPTQA